ncbi:pantothenate transporter Fen2p [[Candida] jaroonii]|uniref:Pantothenate transporter Fen2p n=1 Tax=[Candida] jaroonii TaxID=467808 RepID=A0ACA9YCR9_9ASCO|nr:pantothenate transporter Fen2p [[Candida] jaroonii]
MGVLRSIRLLVWGEAPTNPVEAKLLFKMDWFILSFICLVYWSNYLNRANFASAYTSGLREYAELKGNEFNKINTLFTVGYVVGLIPNNLILLKVKANYWMSFCCLCWGLMTLGLFKSSHYYQFCIIRFFQGIFESVTFTGSHLLLSRWYTETEITKRSAIFTSSGLIGNMFSSFMQAAIHTNMDGKQGLHGFQWLFIIDFVITVPIALYGFLFFPNTPETCTARYFTTEELELAKKRVVPPEHTKIDLSLIKRVLGRWHFWCLSMLWVWFGENESFGTNSLLALYLTYFDYSITHRNTYILGLYGVGIISTFLCGLYVDGTGARYHYRVGIYICIVLLISAIMILVNPLNHSVAMAAYYLSGVSYSGQATFFAWANIICADDLPERAVVLASMNMFSNAVNAWWSLLFYGADTAPKFRKGAIAMICTVFAGLAVALLTRYLQLRDEKKVITEEGSIESTNVSVDKNAVEFKTNEVSSET